MYECDIHAVQAFTHERMFVPALSIGQSNNAMQRKEQSWIWLVSRMWYEYETQQCHSCNTIASKNWRCGTVPRQCG